MNDFLRGTLGRFLQIIFAVISLFLLFAGLMSCATGRTGGQVIGWVLFLFGVLFGSAVFGIRYWLGHVVRIR